MNNSDYFAEQSEFLGDKYSSMDGWDYFAAEDAPSYSNLAGDAPAYSNASHGNGNGKTSQPYIVQVVNANAVTTPAVIFGSYSNRTAANFGNVAGITVTSTFNNVTYGELLAQTENKAFENGMIYIESANAAQITATQQLRYRDANANDQSTTLVPKVDPNQQIATVLEFYYTFPLDGFTQLTIDILAATTVTFTYYPSETLDPANPLIGRAPIQGYRGPRIGKAQTLNLSAQAQRALGM